MIKLISATLLLISLSGQAFAAAGNNFAIKGGNCQFKGTVKADSIGNMLFCGPTMAWADVALKSATTSNKTAVKTAQQKADAAYSLAQNSTSGTSAATIINTVCGPGYSLFSLQRKAWGSYVLCR